MAGQTCANCGTQLRPSGRPSEVLGERFCMTRDCQAVKQRRYRTRVQSKATIIERRPCVSCGDPQQERTARKTDTPLGRWCAKRACQRHKNKWQALYRSLTENAQDYSALATLVNEFYDALRNKKADCSECGTRDNPLGFKHPTMEGVPCVALGGLMVRREEIMSTWPERFPPTSNMLESE